MLSGPDLPTLPKRKKNNIVRRTEGQWTCVIYEKIERNLKMQKYKNIGRYFGTKNNKQLHRRIDDYYVLIIVLAVPAHYFIQQLKGVIKSSVYFCIYNLYDSKNVPYTRGIFVLLFCAYSEINNDLVSPNLENSIILLRYKLANT